MPVIILQNLAARADRSLGKRGTTFRLIRRLLLGVTLAFAGPATFAADSITISQARLGNVFLSTDTVQIPVRSTGDHVTWTATDFFGVPTMGPTVAVGSNGQAILTLKLKRLGYFDLHVTALRNGAAVATAETTFVVVAPSNVSRMRDSAFGVQTHFAQGWNTDVMSLLARGGVAQIRDEQYWQNVEPTLTAPPTYNFANFQPYMALASAASLNPLQELNFANKNYDGGNTPYTSAGCTGYANYCTALLKRYGSQIDTVEIWNEYNGSFCVGPATANPSQYYATMLKQAYTAIKAQSPNMRVVGGACIPVPLPWYQSLFALGALDYLDVLDAHPYVTIPEGVEIGLGQVQTLMASYNHGNGPKPIWATECGEPDNVNQGRQDMARYLVRLMAILRSAGVERVYWYLAHDYNGFTSGLLRASTDPLGYYAPTSAFPAYSNLIHYLYGTSFVQRDNTDPRTRCYLFNGSAGNVRVVWSTVGTAHLVLTTSKPITLVNIMGETSVLRPTNGAIAFAVNKNPIYLVGSISAVEEIGRDVLVADSSADFSGTQGTSNGQWFYGNCTVANNNYDPAALQPMTYTANSTAYVYSSNYPFAGVDSDGGHPSVTGTTPVWTVRRWVSNSAGTAHIVGTAIRSSTGGDGTGAGVYVDGVQVYSAVVGPSGTGTTKIDFTTPIKVGSKVDFVITPGPGSDINFDYILYRVQVSVPQPPRPSLPRGKRKT